MHKSCGNRTNYSSSDVTYDSDSNGLYYMRARYYSATLKRFINADVKKGNIQISESLNSYAYANGNPVNLIDPFGTSSEPGNNTAATVAHTVLDVAGFIPVIGTVTNIASGIWYASEGDYLAMGLSFASAIPIAGDITDGIKVGADAVKIGETAVKGAEDASEIAKAVETSEKTLDDSDKLVVADKSFLNDNGEIDWDKYAPNGGYVKGTQANGQTLNTGAIFDRYGNAMGRYASPKGTSYSERSLPYIENQNAYHQYRVLKTINGVSSGEIASAFNQLGGGIQYELPYSIDYLMNNKYIEEIN